MAHKTPMFKPDHSYRMIPGFGYIELPRTESLVLGDIKVSSQENADTFNYIHEHAQEILDQLGVTHRA